MRGVFAGSGNAFFGEAAAASLVLGLVGKPPPEVRLLYLGTAMYDLPKYKEAQTRRFSELGVAVDELQMACATPSEDTVAAALDAADVVLVSGGNTLYAVDRWLRCELVPPLRRAVERGCVLCGGSAGAICWFDGGHSDSMDPDTYREAMLGGRGLADPDVGGGVPAQPKRWDYIRVDGLGLLPGLLCPHHDRVQSNGVLRADDFDRMLRRHPGETGVCIDHHAALVVDGKRYRVFTLDERPGSLRPDGTCGSGLVPGGVPAIWIKRVLGTRSAADAAGEDVPIEARVLPPEGRLDDVAVAAASIVADPRLGVARAENSCDVG